MKSALAYIWSVLHGVELMIQRRLSAISQAHQAAGHQPSPTSDYRVRQLMRGIRRSLGVAPVRSKAPVAGAELRRLILSTPGDYNAGLRDRAMLLMGQLGAFRRSELLALDFADVEQLEDGLRVRVRRSKTCHEGAGDWKGIPRRSDPEVCAMRALHAWLEAPYWRSK